MCNLPAFRGVGVDEVVSIGAFKISDSINRRMLKNSVITIMLN